MPPPLETPVGLPSGLTDQQLLDAIEKLELATGDMIIVRAPAGAAHDELAQWASNLRRLPQMTGHVVLVAPTGVDVVARPATELISVMKNAIGFSLYSDGRPQGVTADGIPSIEVTDEESERCGAAAQLAYDHLVRYVVGHVSRDE